MIPRPLSTPSIIAASTYSHTKENARHVACYNKRGSTQVLNDVAWQVLSRVCLTNSHTKDNSHHVIRRHPKSSSPMASRLSHHDWR